MSPTNYKLENLIIPDNVTRIEKYAFGGVGVEKILQKTTGYTGTNKAIYISELSLLKPLFSFPNSKTLSLH